ncbi:hypothetical protein SLS56_002012 [Neofusicoccum ribis]|uniref:Uncharacterized protein n=1 Tax=Neofusicoccum ribis TaxID=45134 RepID=A0ABR3T6E4_9PEZI
MSLFGLAVTAPAAEEQGLNGSTQPAEEKAVETTRLRSPAPTVTSEEEEDEEQEEEQQQQEQEQDIITPLTLGDDLKAAALTEEGEKPREPPPPQASRDISLGLNPDAWSPTEKAKGEGVGMAEAEAQASTDDPWENMSTRSSSTLCSVDLDEVWDEEELDAWARGEERRRLREKEREHQEEERSMQEGRLTQLECTVQRLAASSAAYHDSMQRQATSIIQAHKGVASVRWEVYRKQEEHEEVAKVKMETLLESVDDRIDKAISGREQRLKISFEDGLDELYTKLQGMGDTRITKAEKLMEEERDSTRAKMAELREDFERVEGESRKFFERREGESRKLFDEQRAELRNAEETVSSFSERLVSVHKASAETAKRTTHLQGLLSEVADGMRAEVAMLKEKGAKIDQHNLVRHSYLLQFRAQIQQDLAKITEAQRANDAKFQKQAQELDELRRTLMVELELSKANKENSTTLLREASAQQKADKTYLESQMHMQMSDLKGSLEAVRKMMPAPEATQQRRDLATKAEIEGQIQSLSKSLEETTGRIQRLEAEEEAMKEDHQHTREHLALIAKRISNDWQTPEISSRLNDVATRLKSGFDRFADEVQAVKNHVNHVWDFVAAQQEQNLARVQGDLESKFNRLRDELATLTR